MKKQQIIIILLLTLAGGINRIAAQGTAFTYQGVLTDSGGPLNAFYDLTFTLYDSGPGPGGNPVGSPNSSNNVKVSGGLVTTSLDFGSGAFNGQPRWLEITVHPHAGGPTTTLSPRQPLTPAPYAIYAENAGGVSGGNWSVNGTSVYYNGGNVGIGTSTPASSSTFLTEASTPGLMAIQSHSAGPAVPPTSQRKTELILSQTGAQPLTETRTWSCKRIKPPISTATSALARARPVRHWMLMETSLPPRTIMAIRPILC